MARIGKHHEGPDAASMPTVGDLVEAAIAKTSATRLSEAMGVDRAWVYELRKNSVRNFPDVENVQQYAKALGVEVETLILAFAKTLGLPLEGSSRLAAFLPPEAKRLNDRQITALVELIRSMVTEEPAVTVRPIRPKPSAPVSVPKAARTPSTPRAQPQVDP